MKTHQLTRRDAVTLLGSAAVAWPLPAPAQEPVKPTIGYLSTGTPQADATPFLAAFRQGLRELGYVEGRNTAIEYRWAEFQYDRLFAMAADLANRPVAAIAAIGGTPTGLAAKAATSTVPVVFYLGIDPVKFGLVASFNRPSGNLTGVAALQADLAAKRIELLREVVSRPSTFALLVNPANPYSEPEIRSVLEAAGSLGLQLPHVVRASTVVDVELAFAALQQHRNCALIVSADLFLLSRREQLVALASRHGFPTVYPWREYVPVGGLMSYGPSLFDAYRLVGVYVGKILKGARPGDLPVEQATKIEFLINLEAAKTLGLTVPLAVASRADEVIE
jgi:putative ABC transport system substrate-binding protein